MRENGIEVFFPLSFLNQCFIRFVQEVERIDKLLLKGIVCRAKSHRWLDLHQLDIKIVFDDL